MCRNVQRYCNRMPALEYFSRPTERCVSEKQVCGLHREAISRRRRIERKRQRPGRGFEVFERLGFERYGKIVLRKRRRNKRGLKFGIERRMFDRWGKGGFGC